jgi:heat-inducible transcriptional repressor
MLSGMTLAQAQTKLRADIAGKQIDLDKAAQRLIQRGLAQWSADADERPVLIVRGQANLLDEHANMDIDRVRQLLDELETKGEIAHLLASAGRGAATQIFIGSENKLFALSGSSVIAAPAIGAEGRLIGVVGVIGPTRLNYARIVPMVDFTAQTLSKLLR